ncbi:class I SAM-dependent methyltransferase [Rhizobium sp. L1K21]|uniref:class I SAM-dependent methyltransferase n=1 Tax=Rhizobium sp. L1K21 TaxID=2954933 RepID=UPI002093AEA1|nr:class I SAM-dependent methyltransferase [Rhizobium sp. L1K21]MCO6186307.1 class I SAM-dependent methyltransferase [Rhizobium sp. L1K21]
MRVENMNFEIDKHSLITPALIKEHIGTLSDQIDADQLGDRQLELILILEMSRRSFANGEPAAEITDRLGERLHALREKCAPEVWEHLVPVAQGHPLGEYIFQDPFTNWSFTKPRGYSGDAGLIDLLYHHESTREILAQSTELGRAIYAYTSNTPPCVAGRERRDILAHTVDATAKRVCDGAEILAVACGHLREAELSEALKAGTLKRWIALDQDTESVELVEKKHQNSLITAINGSVSGLLRRSYKIGKFDLAYAAGLYDYLPRAVAIRLTQRLVEMLKVGGEFLFANFSDEVGTDGYMETFMNWQLIFRSEDDMWDIINASVDRNKVKADVFFGENRYICYAKLRKIAD